jgi:hypothetical protein
VSSRPAADGPEARGGRQGAALKALLVAEAVRHYAESGRIDIAELTDDYAESEARRAGGRVSRRITAWAGSLRIAERFEKPLADVQTVLWVVLGLFVAIGFVTGFTTGGTALGASGTVNILYVLGALLGVQLFLLALWLVLMAVPSRPGAPSPIGRLAVWLAVRLGDRPGRPSVERAVWMSFRTLFREGAPAKWGLSAVSHAVWLAFSLGALVSATLWMVLFQYDFVWETTLLREETAVALIAALAFLPDFLGLAAPDEALIAASRFDSGPGVGREVWSRFLLAGVFLYGVLPRLIALAVATLMTYRTTAKLDIDLTEPFFSTVWQRLQPAEPPAETLEPPPPPDLGGAPGAAPRRTYGSGKFVATVAVELDDPGRWPIAPAHWRQLDLGIIDGRVAARRLLGQLQSDFPEPRAFVIVASMARTPDRGAADLLARIAAAADVPVLLVLAEGSVLAKRGGDPEVRAHDWRRYAEAAGVHSVAVMELDALAAARVEEIERMIDSSATSEP